MTSTNQGLQKARPQIMGITLGNPYSSGTYSGVPYHLFAELDKTGNMAGRLNGYLNRPTDFFHGVMDWSRTIRALRLRRNAFWRYLPENMDRVTKRLIPLLEQAPEHDVALQVGVGGIGKRQGKLFAAHAEIAIETASNLPAFSESYGFARTRKNFLKRAKEGEAQFLHACDLIWTNSNWTAATFAEYGIPKEKFWVHAPACNFDDPGEITHRWDEPHILFVGKDWGRKGGPVLIEAFRILRSRIPSARLTIIGCSTKINESGVSVLGFLNKSLPEDAAKIRNAYAQATVFCMPSVWESVGLVYMEAALYGLPVVMLDGQGRRDIFPETMASFLTESSATQLADELYRLCSDPALAQKMGGAGRQHVLQNYMWPVVADRLLDRISGSMASARH